MVGIRNTKLFLNMIDLIHLFIYISLPGSSLQLQPEAICLKPLKNRVNVTCNKFLILICYTQKKIPEVKVHTHETYVRLCNQQKENIIKLTFKLTLVNEILQVMMSIRKISLVSTEERGG